MKNKHIHQPRQLSSKKMRAEREKEKNMWNELWLLLVLILAIIFFKG